MKKILTLVSIIALSMTLPSKAQLTINPKIGIVFLNFSDPPEGIEFNGEVGVIAGADVRIGDKFFFAPGLHYMQTAVVIKYADSSNVTIPDNKVKNNYLKLKAILGYNIVHADAFKFRAFLGPTYDIHLGTTSENNSIDKDTFKSGVFNAEAGLGVDILFISVDLGYTYGLTNVFEEEKFDSKHLGIFAQAGVAIKF